MKMRVQIRFAVALLVACGQIFGAAATPGQAALQQRGLRLKEDFNAGKVDGMRILVLKAEGSAFVPVDPGRIFQAGDEIRVAFESNFDGYVYVVNVSPVGTKRVIFPGSRSAAGSNVVRARQRIELPPTSFIFDKEVGTEILQVIMSREPIAVLDAAVKGSQGELQSASSAAGELSANTQRGIVSENVAVALPSGLRARGVFLAQGKDKDKTGSVVAIADDKQSEGRLKTGEVASFEIRLQHN